MEAALIIAAVTAAFGMILYALHRLSHGKTGDDTDAGASETPTQTQCCGMHIVCEKDSLIKGISDEIVYYDDEELDAYKGLRPEEYTESQTEEFRDVLLTLLPDDIAGWARSLQLRGIALPKVVEEELLFLVAEERQKRNITN